MPQDPAVTNPGSKSYKRLKQVEKPGNDRQEQLYFQRQRPHILKRSR